MSSTKPDLIDTARELDTAEGCPLTLRRAGVAARAGAWLVDAAIRAGVLIALSMVLATMRQIGVGMLVLVAFGLEWFYPFLCEMLMNGTTPGKRSMGLMVVNDNGTPLTWGSSAMRNLMRAFDFFPWMYGFGACAMLLGDGSKRLGDWVAGTIVVYRDEAPARRSVDQGTEVMVLPVALRVEEQRALVDYVRRDGLFTRERSEELAAAADPLVSGQAPRQAREQLLAMGRYLLGQA